MVQTNMSGASLVKSVSVPTMAPRFWFPNQTPQLVPSKRKLTLPARKRDALFVRELTSNNDELESLSSILRRIDYAGTFALRSLLDNIFQCRLNNARVFVSEIESDFQSIDRNNLKAVSIIYSVGTSTLEEKYDEEIDNAATWASDQESCLRHLRTLADQRRWHQRGVVFVNFPSNLLPQFELVFDDRDRRYVSPQPPSRLYISDPYTKRQLRDRLEQSSRDLPSNFLFDRLRSEDAEVVAENWDFARPRKLDYVRWLIDEFVGVCVRDTDSDDDRPVSWGLINEFGAKGFKFVAPEYRRHGLSVSNMYALLLASVDSNFFLNLKKGFSKKVDDDDDDRKHIFHALVADENEASIRGNAKARFVPTETRCTRLVYKKRVLMEKDKSNL